MNFVRKGSAVSISSEPANKKQRISEATTAESIEHINKKQRVEEKRTQLLQVSPIHFKRIKPKVLPFLAFTTSAAFDTDRFDEKLKIIIDKNKDEEDLEFITECVDNLNLVEAEIDN